MGVISERLCRHHWLPIHITVYLHVPGRQRGKDADGGEEEGLIEERMKGAEKRRRRRRRKVG